MSTETFLFKLKADSKDLVNNMKKAKDETKGVGSEFKKSTNKGIDFQKSLKGIGTAVTLVGTALTAATAAFVSYATVQGRAIRETEVLATMAGLSVDEFNRLSFVMGTVGVSGEKFGDIMKDTQEKIGDFIASGGGAFQDFADVMGLSETQALKLAQEFEKMSGQEVLQAMVTKMQEAGKTTQQMSFALEGMASDTTRLIPLLLDGGKAAEELGDKFDEIDNPLTEQQREQFKELANNVDLATKAFTTFVNSGIAPFVGVMNEAAVALKDFFILFNNADQIDDLLDDKSIISNIDNLTQLAKIQESVNEQIKDYSHWITQYSKAGMNSDEQIDRVVALRELNGEIEQQINLLKTKQEVENSFVKIDEDNSPQNTNKSGADTINDGQKIEDELSKLQDAKKTKLQLLNEEKQERLSILSDMYANDASMAAHYADLKKQVEQDFRLQIFEFAQTDQEAKQQAYADELASVKQLFEEKLISEADYYEKRNEIIAEFAPSTLDPDILEEENQAELDALKEKLDQKLMTHREYYDQLAILQNKDLKDKENKSKLESSWSESAIKKQMDDGTALLNYLGTNSKTAHKIKQGLAVANAGMNTAEGVTKALADQNYVGAALTAATGAAQIAAILASTPDGGTSTAAVSTVEASEAEAVDTSDQTTSVIDLSSEGSSTQTFKIEFTDEVIDVIATKITESDRDGRT